MAINDYYDEAEKQISGGSAPVAQPGRSETMTNLRDSAMGVKAGVNNGSLAASATMPNAISAPPIKSTYDPYGAMNRMEAGATPPPGSVIPKLSNVIPGAGSVIPTADKVIPAEGKIIPKISNPTVEKTAKIDYLANESPVEPGSLMGDNKRMRGGASRSFGEPEKKNPTMLGATGSKITAPGTINLNKKYGVDKQGLLPSGKPFEPTNGSFSVQSREQMWGNPATDKSAFEPKPVGMRSNSKSPFPESVMKFTPQTFKPGELGSDKAGREAMGIKGNYIDGSGLTDQQYALKNLADQHEKDGERIQNMKPSQVTEMRALSQKYNQDASTLAQAAALESKSGDLQKVGPGEAAFRDGKPFAYNPGPDKTAGKRSAESSDMDKTLGQYMKNNPNATMSPNWNNNMAAMFRDKGWKIIEKNGKRVAQHLVTGEIYPITDNQGIPEEEAE